MLEYYYNEYDNLKNPKTPPQKGQGQKARTYVKSKKQRERSDNSLIGKSTQKKKSPKTEKNLQLKKAGVIVEKKEKSGKTKPKKFPKKRKKHLKKAKNDIENIQKTRAYT